MEGPDGQDMTVIWVRGGIAADRARQLWAAIEGALQWAVGGRVVVDLSQVSGFDVGSIEELADAARAAARRHDDLCAVVAPHSALDDHVRSRGLAHQLVLYGSLAAAVSGVSSPADGLAIRAGELVSSLGGGHLVEGRAPDDEGGR